MVATTALYVKQNSILFYASESKHSEWPPTLSFCLVNNETLDLHLPTTDCHVSVTDMLQPISSNGGTASFHSLFHDWNWRLVFTFTHTHRHSKTHKSQIWTHIALTASVEVKVWVVLFQTKAMELFYYLVFGGLAVVVAAMELSKSNKDRFNTSSSFNSFKNNYLVVYSLMMGKSHLPISCCLTWVVDLCAVDDDHSVRVSLLHLDPDLFVKCTLWHYVNVRV